MEKDYGRFLFLKPIPILHLTLLCFKLKGQIYTSYMSLRHVKRCYKWGCKLRTPLVTKMKGLSRVYELLVLTSGDP